jgi:hypothetical protein
MSLIRARRSPDLEYNGTGGGNRARLEQGWKFTGMIDM